MERHIGELNAQQRAQGHVVTQVFTVGQQTGVTDVQVLAGWPILHLWPHALRDLIFYASASWRCWRLRLRADVLHVHGDWSAYACGHFLGRILRARVKVCSMHGAIGTDRRSLRHYRWVSRGYDVRYATGLREAAVLSRVVGKEWHWIASGLARSLIEGFEEGAAKRNDVIAVGSLVPVKGLDLLMEVARCLPGCHIAIVGDGREESRLRALASDLPNVTFLGALSQPALARELSASRLYVSTSHAEGTPTTMLEAMAAGLPVITTASNDYSVVLGAGIGGEVLDGRDADAMALSVANWLGDPRRSAAASLRNREYAGRRTWPWVAAEISRLLELAVRAERKA